ncbi:hypothetical protein IAT38_005522 [Cryptococcus sp. DSM 104549]
MSGPGPSAMFPVGLDNAFNTFVASAPPTDFAPAAPHASSSSAAYPPAPAPTAGPSVSTPHSSRELPTPRRAKTGCITCRLRKKRCDETKPVCATCSRLGIECMGYGVKRPKWLREKDNAQKAKAHIKQTVLSKRTARAKTDDGSPDNDGSTGSCGSIDGGNGQGSGLPESGGGSGSGDLLMDEDSLWDFGVGAAAATASGSEWGMPEVSTEGFQKLTGFQTGDPFSTGVPPAPSYVAGTVAGPTNYPGSPPSASLISNAFANTAESEGELDDLWTSLFGQTYPASWGSIPSQPLPVVTTPPGQSPAYFAALNSPSIPISLSPPMPSPTSDLNYLHHYLKVVLPLQYRVMGISILMADFVAPLAISRPEVLASVSSLAALHLVSQRTKNRNRLHSPGPSTNQSIITTASGSFRVGSASISEIGDDEALVATTAHQRSIERLQFLSPQDLTTEEVILSVLFAISYHLFSGGTSKHIREMLSISQRCLSAALASSPELQEQGATRAAPTPNSPWARYRHLIEHMIWTDIIASVSQNKASRLLPSYRRILTHLPAEQGNPPPLLLMDKVMGCDSTTLLALAEIVALSEWRERAEKQGCLSFRELMRRAQSIEQLLDERAWRESHLDRPNTVPHLERPRPIPESVVGQAPSDDLRRAMSDVFFGSAKVLLATVINGPYPRVPDVAEAVQDTLEALHRLDIEHPHSEIHRALVLPITIAGCHCETPSQQNFFRHCFERLGTEAQAFGNTGPALELMEEMWRRRAAAGETDVRVEMRETMTALGWEAGILLI